MKKTCHLKICAVCRRALALFGLSGFVLRSLKNRPACEEKLEEMRRRSSGYDGLLNRKSQKYRRPGLHVRWLGQAHCGRLILRERAPSPRPVFLAGDRVFMGGRAKRLGAFKDCLEALRADGQRS